MIGFEYKNYHLISGLDKSFDKNLILSLFIMTSFHTLFTSKNESQKIEQVPIARASRNFPLFKTRNTKKFYNLTLEIIPFIRFGKKIFKNFIHTSRKLKKPLKKLFELRCIRKTTNEKTKSNLGS